MARAGWVAGRDGCAGWRRSSGRESTGRTQDLPSVASVRPALPAARMAGPAKTMEMIPSAHANRTCNRRVPRSVGGEAFRSRQSGARWPRSGGQRFATVRLACSTAALTSADGCANVGAGRSREAAVDMGSRWRYTSASANGLDQRYVAPGNERSASPGFPLVRGQPCWSCEGATRG